MTNYIEEARKLSNSQLHNLLKNRTGAEREILAEIVSYISEVDRRQLFENYHCTSLFDYLTTEMKYSTGAAQRRIDAARLMNAAPEMKEKIESGELTLAQVSVVASALKQAKREQKGTSTVEVKRELIEKVISKPIAEAQQAVAEHLNLEIKTFDKKVVQRDKSVRLEITFSEDEAKLLAEVKDLLSHTNPGASAKEILVIALLELKKKKDPTMKGLRKKPEAKVTSTVEVRPAKQVTSTVEVPAQQPPTKNPTAAARNLVFTKHKCCQWQFSNGQVCGSTFQLQVDHIKSKWLGGGNEVENYQVLCSAHNKLKYRQEIGLH